MSRSIAAAAALLALAGLAGAQDPDLDAERARAKALAQGLKGYDEGLAGTTAFGVYLRGAKNVGHARLIVEPAPEDGVPATYQVRLEVDLAFGGTEAGQRETLLLGDHLQTTSVRQTETVNQDSAVEQTHTEIDRTGRQWVSTRREGTVRRTTQLDLGGFVHQGLSSRLLLARKLAGSAPGTYRFQEIEWPALPLEGEAPPEPRSRDVVFTVGKAAPTQHRGKTVQAISMQIERADEATSTILVDTRGALLAFWAEGSPLRMVAGDAAQASADLGPVRTIKPGLGSPLAVTALYIYVTAQLEDVDTLDRILDWEALQKDMAKRDRQWNRFEPHAFRARLKSSLERGSGLTKEQVDLFLEVLDETVSGDEATVSSPSLARPFKLKKLGGRWKLVSLPD